jgi:hypothetical protein
MRKKTFIYMLSDQDRKRHEHLAEKGKIMGFVVQNETLFRDNWMPVVRYDTAHGYAHKDLIDPDGSKEKILIGTVELSEALTFADKDINENWERYKDRFLRRIKT